MALRPASLRKRVPVPVNSACAMTGSPAGCQSASDQRYQPGSPTGPVREKQRDELRDDRETEFQAAVCQERSSYAVGQLSAKQAPKGQPAKEAGDRHADRERRAAEHELKLFEPDNLVDEGSCPRSEKHHINGHENLGLCFRLSVATAAVCRRLGLGFARRDHARLSESRSCSTRGRNSQIDRYTRRVSKGSTLILEREWKLASLVDLRQREAPVSKPAALS